MPACPMCNKPLRELTRKCPTCQADLDLLVDFSSGLKGNLQRAETLTRNGELAQAVWTYLEVLDVDPENTAARTQIGKIVSAVRHFDTQSPLRKMADPAKVIKDAQKGISPQTVRAMMFGGIFTIVFALGVILGFVLAGGNIGAGGAGGNVTEEKPQDTLGP